MSSNGTSFLDRYLQYTSKQESPDLFHFWVGMTVTAAALGRKCYLDKGYYRLFPNLFTILVAGSARCRKSTAINIGVSLLEKVTGARVVSGKITPERFIDEIAPDPGSVAPSILVHSSELSVFLTKQQYGEPLISILTDMYDCPDSWSYKTKNRGETNLKDLFLCIIAASTPDSIASSIPQTALTEGFASRVLFVFQEDTEKRNALPELTLEERMLKVELIGELAEIHKMEGLFHLDAEAREWYIAWYGQARPPEDKWLEGMFARRHDHLLRLGMILAASFHRQTIEINDLQAADMALNDIEKLTPYALREIGGDAKTSFLSRAETMIRRRERITHSELLRNLYPLTAEDLRKIMETLISADLVCRDPEKPSVYVAKKT